jgi:DDE superfamily endonuclease
VADGRNFSINQETPTKKAHQVTNAITALARGESPPNSSVRRTSGPPKTGQPKRSTGEYKRNATVNLFGFSDAHRPWRKVEVTDSRAAVDFAARMRNLTDVHHPKTEHIRVVVDNLSTHSAGALYKSFQLAKHAQC